MKTLSFIVLLITSVNAYSDVYKWTHSNGVVEFVNRVPESIAPNDTLVRVEVSGNSSDIIQTLPSGTNTYFKAKPVEYKTKNKSVKYAKQSTSKEKRVTKSTLEILENATRIREGINQKLEQERVAINNRKASNNAEEFYDPVKAKCERYQRKYDEFNDRLRARHRTSDGNYYRRERNKYSNLLYRECR